MQERAQAGSEGSGAHRDNDPEARQGHKEADQRQDNVVFGEDRVDCCSDGSTSSAEACTRQRAVRRIRRTGRTGFLGDERRLLRLSHPWKEQIVHESVRDEQTQLDAE